MKHAFILAFGQARYRRETIKGVITIFIPGYLKSDKLLSWVDAICVKRENDTITIIVVDPHPVSGSDSASENRGTSFYNDISNHLSSIEKRNISVELESDIKKAKEKAIAFLST